MYPTDSRGQICGKDLAQGKPYLFYFDLTQCMSATVLITGCLTETKCVESCPTSVFSWMEFAASPSKIDTARLICSESINVSQIQNFRELTSAISAQQCASYYFPSGSVGGRCLPGLGRLQNGSLFKIFEEDNLVTTSNARNETVTHQDAFNGSKWLATVGEAQLFLADAIDDIKNIWWLILVCYLLAGILAYIWILGMKWMASWLVWLAIVGFLSMLSYFAYYCFHMAETLKAVGGTDGRLVFTLDLSTYATKQDFWLALGSVVCIVLAVIVLVILHLRQRIKIAISLLEEGSKAVSSIKSALLFPLFPCILEAATLAWGVAIGLYLISSYVLEGRIIVSDEAHVDGLRENDTCDPNNFETTYPNSTAKCRFTSYYPPAGLRAYEVGNLFTMLWTIFFIGAASDMTLAGIFAIYYWTWDKSRLPTGMITTSLWRTCRFHLGSAAFGALLVTVIRIVRGLINSMHKNIKAFSGNQTGALLKCCLCCLWCLEKFLRFINRNAYIVIAIYGKSFLFSAEEAYFLLMRNILRFVALDSITAFILLLGKAVIAGLLGAASYYYIQQRISVFGLDVPEIRYVAIPVAAVVVGTYFIETQFLQVYEMAVDTIFLCFLEDSEQNDGSPEKPYFMTRKLMMLLEKKTTAPSIGTEKEQHHNDLAETPEKT
ncbi:choline transporter-like protein 2 isoform X2 [Paramacrobiotus metropolitanus]|nr:choline transporter-like protein 2 isoform X2 [Paramacrobiotus metropolitanus]